jgi:hypothetical protein
MKIQARFNYQAFRWLRPGPRSGSARLAEIKARFTRDLRKIEKLQAVEARELFPPSEKVDISVQTDTNVQPARPDLNQEISVALANHSVQTSPADCPSLRDYGVFIESTRSEKSITGDRILLGLRGSEAVQVSSHRGPPTDRPPDKPVETSVFAGCSEERPNARRTYQLASFARSSHCLSGNVPKSEVKMKNAKSRISPQPIQFRPSFRAKVTLQQHTLTISLLGSLGILRLRHTGERKDNSKGGNNNDNTFAWSGP